MPGSKLCPWSGTLPGVVAALILCAVCPGWIEAQTHASDSCQAPVSSAGGTAPLPSLPRHLLLIFPNHNGSPCLSPYVPIGSKRKFKIAMEDAFDPRAVAVAALTGGAAQLVNSNRPFGQEASGYSRYFAASYANHVIGDFLTEGLYPSLLHQDPRYFRKGSGSTAGRLSYAISRVFRTQTDAGQTAFNYSLMLGASSTIAVSTLYYANHRDAAGSAVGFGARIGGSLAANILKEFWPDFIQNLSAKRSAGKRGMGSTP